MKAEIPGRYVCNRSLALAMLKVLTGNCCCSLCSALSAKQNYCPPPPGHRSRPLLMQHQPFYLPTPLSSWDYGCILYNQRAAPQAWQFCHQHPETAWERYKVKAHPHHLDIRQHPTTLYPISSVNCTQERNANRYCSYSIGHGGCP